MKLEKIDVFGNNISDLNLNPANLKHIIDLNIGNNNFNDANQLFEVLGQLENVQKLGLFNIEPMDNLGWMSNGVFNTDSGEEGLWRLNIIGTSITDISDLSSLSNFLDSYCFMISAMDFSGLLDASVSLILGSIGAGWYTGFFSNSSLAFRFAASLSFLALMAYSAYN